MYAEKERKAILILYEIRMQYLTNKRKTQTLSYTQWQKIMRKISFKKILMMKERKINEISVNLGKSGKKEKL